MKLAYPASNGGFSLIEIVVTLAILSIILTAASPYLNYGRSHRDLRPFVATMASELRQARLDAMRQNRDIDVYFNLDKRTYTITPANHTSALPAGASIVITSAAQARRREADSRVVFFADGSSTGGTISLSGFGERFTVSINWMTGVVTVEDVP